MFSMPARKNTAAPSSLIVAGRAWSLSSNEKPA